MGMETANRLYNLMAEHEITAYELADIAGVHYTAVYQWLKGKYKPSQTTAKNISDFFGISVADILPNTEQEYTPLPVISDETPFWISMQDRQPETVQIPKDRTEWEYMQTFADRHADEYLIIREDGTREICEWCNGWNCTFNYDSGHDEWYVSHKHEYTDVLAWAEIPAYKGIEK